MEPLETHLDSSSDDFKANAQRLESLVDDLKGRLGVARQGGGDKYLARHREQGKAFVRDRIASVPTVCSSL